MTIFETLHSTGENGMKTVLEAILNAVMKIERDYALNAEPYERSTER